LIIIFINKIAFKPNLPCFVNGEMVYHPALVLGGPADETGNQNQSAETSMNMNMNMSIRTVLILDRKEIQTIYGCVKIAQKALYDETAMTAQFLGPEERKAIKIFIKQKIRNTPISEDYQSELRLQKYLSDPELNNGNPTVMPIDTVLEDTNNIYVVLPYAEGGELFEYVATSAGQIGEKEGRHLFQNMAMSVAYIHSKNVAHRDVSLENYVLSNLRDKIPILIDFGLAITLERDDDGSWKEIEYQQPFGKPAYLSPEFFLISRLHAKAKKEQQQSGDTSKPLKRYSYDGAKQDIWALGVCLWMILFGRNPWKIPYWKSDHNYYRIVTKVDLRGWLMSKGLKLNTYTLENGSQVQFWEKDQYRLSEEVVDLLQNILRQDPEDRYTAEEILRHPWITQDTL